MLIVIYCFTCIFAWGYYFNYVLCTKTFWSSLCLLTDRINYANLGSVWEDLLIYLCEFDNQISTNYGWIKIVMGLICDDSYYILSADAEQACGDNAILSYSFAPQSSLNFHQLIWQLLICMLACTWKWQSQLKNCEFLFLIISQVNKIILADFNYILLTFGEK